MNLTSPFLLLTEIALLAHWLGDSAGVPGAESSPGNAPIQAPLSITVSPRVPARPKAGTNLVLSANHPGQLPPITMQAHLLNEALRIIKSEQYLVNMVSQRVRQLTQGARAMIEVGPRMGFADIALTEIIEGKLSFKLAPEAAPEPPLDIPLLPAFGSKNRTPKSPPEPVAESLV